MAAVREKCQDARRAALYADPQWLEHRERGAGLGLQTGQVNTFPKPAGFWMLPNGLLILVPVQLHKHIQQSVGTSPLSGREPADQSPIGCERIVP
ncbi:MAG: hypothetical protein KDJ51_07290 [Nitratireductor sp.]|nr:hypothetical protein [Nitratireductor sp.]